VHVVLVAPEIPPNTGNVARLCVGTGTALHLVRPLGFSLSDRHLRRAGLDYWDRLDLTVHDDFDSVLAAKGDAPMHLASVRAGRPYTDAAYTDADWLVFGAETAGLPPDLLARFADRGIRIPMWGPCRCLNLSNAVAVMVFEALRRTRPAAFYPPAPAPAAASASGPRAPGA
jgi:tRNA (cytidine/uridine-2'-O-)-methyltransferase